MTPATLAKSGSEHGEQVALFAYAAIAKLYGFEAADAWAVGAPLDEIKNSMIVCAPVPALEWLHAIPNGGSRGDDEKSRKIRGANLKAEGVRQGVADVFLPWPSAGWHGLYIEMKKPALKPKKEGSAGGVSEDQQEFGTYVKNVGYGWVVCYSWREAANVLRSYVEFKAQ